MGAKNLGQFEFFDAEKNLSVDEKAQLQIDHIEVLLADVRSLADTTLAYKNSRVLLFQSAAESSSGASFSFHLAECEAVTEARLQADSSWRVTTADPKLLPLLQNHQVCSACLQRLHYQDFDMSRHRHRDYSERVKSGFSVSEFFKHYPSYPIEEERDSSFL